MTDKETEHDKETAYLPPLDLNQRYTIDEAARYLRISRPRLYKHINAGLIQTIKDGTRRYVPGSEIARASRAPEGKAA